MVEEGSDSGQSGWKSCDFCSILLPKGETGEKKEANPNGSTLDAQGLSWLSLTRSVLTAILPGRSYYTASQMGP